MAFAYVIKIRDFTNGQTSLITAASWDLDSIEYIFDKLNLVVWGLQ